MERLSGVLLLHYTQDKHTKSPGRFERPPHRPVLHPVTVRPPPDRRRMDPHRHFPVAVRRIPEYTPPVEPDLKELVVCHPACSIPALSKMPAVWAACHQVYCWFALRWLKPLGCRRFVSRLLLLSRRQSDWHRLPFCRRKPDIAVPNTEHLSDELLWFRPADIYKLIPVWW